MGKALLEIENPVHKSVMINEAMEFLCPRPDGIYIDATLGLGGHTEAIFKISGFQTRVLGFDVDDESLTFSKKRLSVFAAHVDFINKNFSEIKMVLESLGIDEVDGIIADLGMSSFHIEGSGRGFSFLRDEPLDMRMDSRLRFTAYDLINEMDEDEISKILRIYGEEKWAKRIAREILGCRRVNPIKRSTQLADIVSNAIPRQFHPNSIHPATKTFQALRIAVNNELENLERFLADAVRFLKIGGRVVVISFHSLEDRMVKNSFKRMSSPCVCPPGLPICGCGRKSSLKILTSSPLVPDEAEILNNSRARSAKLRAGEKI